MPFTPIHTLAEISIKSLLQGGFSFRVFGCTQIVLDIKPHMVLLSGEGHFYGLPVPF